LGGCSSTLPPFDEITGIRRHRKWTVLRPYPLEDIIQKALEKERAERTAGTREKFLGLDGRGAHANPLRFFCWRRSQLFSSIACRNLYRIQLPY